uniref:MFS domain-containing protein n=2 Tax=Caenorhabditis japonica TaxID=281687 RepID=A0A8R1DMT9_CAEJA
MKEVSLQPVDEQSAAPVSGDTSSAGGENPVSPVLKNDDSSAERISIIRSEGMTRRENSEGGDEDRHFQPLMMASPTTSFKVGDVEKKEILSDEQVPEVRSSSQSSVDSVEEVTTMDELLEVTTAWRPYPLFIIFSMSFLWSLCALSAISPAFTASTEECVNATSENCTFWTVQNEFRLPTTWILQPGELTTSVYFLGNLLIGQMFAVVADRFGRRPIVIASLLFTGVAGTLGAFAPSFSLFLVARFVQGSCYTPLTTVNYVLSAESIPNRSHSITSIFFGLSWVAGYCFLAPMSVWFNTWRSLQFATAIPNIIFALFLMFTLPESLAYSIEKNDRKAVGRWIERNETLSCRRIAHNLDLIMEKDRQTATEGLTVVQTLKTIMANAEISRRMYLETLLWIFTFMTYCALSLTSTNVGNSDPLVSFVFSGAVELPAYLFIPILLKWSPRIPTRCVCHLTGALSLIAMYYLSPESTWHLPIWLLAKFCAACCYIFCFIYAAELFPTFCRSCCIGVCSTSCNIGAIVAPHIFVVDSVMPGGQFLVLAVVGVACAVLSCLQPETKV